MNVIVSNRYAALLSNLNIDLIKSINGEFNVENLIAQFDNFFFKNMILDITAITNYQDINEIQKLSLGIDMSKVILLLDDSPIVNSPQYISNLVSIGVYNFTKNLDGVKFLLEHPNTYQDVAQFQNLAQQSMNNNANNMNNPNNMNNNQQMSNNPQGNPNMSNIQPGPQFVGGNKRVIGFKNLTDHAGATTLVYMLKKQLDDDYSVLALELDKNDFMFLGDSELKSIKSDEFLNVLDDPTMSYNIVLVDVNSSMMEDHCTEMIYLMEPSTIMLNKMMKRDKNILTKIKEKKVVLNKSLLDARDIKTLEYESGCRIFFNIMPLNDKNDKHRVLDEFLSKMGFNVKMAPKKSVGLFGISKE